MDLEPPIAQTLRIIKTTNLINKKEPVPADLWIHFKKRIQSLLRYVALLN